MSEGSGKHLARSRDGDGGTAVTGGGTLDGAEEQSLAALLNQGYVCPADAGPLWRAAHEAGVDMGLIEDSLRLEPIERLRQHQRSLNQILMFASSRLSDDSRS